MISYVFINGCFSDKLSDLRFLPKNVVSDITQNGVSIRVPKACVVPYPIHVHYFCQNQEGGHYCPRNIFLVEENSYVTVVEEYTAHCSENYITIVTTDICVETNASLCYYKIQNEDITSTHRSCVSIQQKKNSVVKTFFADKGGRSVSHDLKVHQIEKGAVSDMTGFYLLSQDMQQLDNQVSVNHAAQHGKSSMLYKGILDKKTRALFNGKVTVQEAARCIAAKQENHNVLLSEHAEVLTKPELEIYTDDVFCSHGATVGQLDEDSLFYLTSRGIEKHEAITLLVKAFSSELFEKIENNFIKQYVMQQVNHAIE